MTSRITIYKTKLEPGLNAKVDDINYYLNHLQTRLIYSECQYQKLELEMKIKVEMNQKYHFGAKGYNYLKLEQDSKVYYFFILDSKWKANETVELILSMDTVNTFVDSIEFNANTHITRQHKDRFVRDLVPQSGFVTLIRKVDKTNEGINPTKFYDNNKKKIYDETLESTGNDNIIKSKWYLIYKASQELSTTNLANPIEVYCTSNYAFQIEGLLNGIQYTDYPPGTLIAITNIDNRGRTITYTSPTSVSQSLGDNTTCRGFNLYFTSSGIRVTAVGTSLSQIDNRLIFQNVQMTARIFTSTDYTGANIDFSKWISDVMVNTISFLHFRQQNTLRTVNEIDRTNSQYMKIIELPYPPFEFEIDMQNRIQVPDGWTIKDGMFFTDSPEQDFYRLVGVQPLDMMKYNLNATLIRKTDSPIIEMESKLYNSEFYDFNIRYDSFEKQYLLERFNATKAEDCEYQVMFKPTNTINSNFLFEFYDLYEVYQELDVRSQYMNVQRNNEVPLYTSDYVNYIRNGYNYDVKNKTAQTGQSIAGTGINIIGSVAQATMKSGFAKSSAVGLAVTAAASVISTVANAAANDRAIQQKLDELKNSPSSVNGSDDLDLMNYITSNKLEEYTNSCSEEMKKAVFELLRLTGYNCNEYGVPVTDTRLWFNFVQCEPVFRDEELLELPKDVLDDIKAKYQIGVTYFHKVDNTYDFERDYENYESWMINR